MEMDYYFRRKYAVRMSVTRSAEGFTLVELLIAMAIMALLTLMSWRGINALLLTQRNTQQIAQQTAVLQTALAQWISDFDHVSYRAEYVNGFSPVEYDGERLILLRYDPMSADRPLRVVAWAKRTSEPNNTAKDATGMWLRWQSSAVRTHGELATAWQDARRWADAANRSDLEKLRANEVEILAITEWEVQSFDSVARNWMGKVPIPLTTAGGSNLSVDAIRLVLKPAPGQAFSAEIVRDWVRPTL